MKRSNVLFVVFDALLVMWLVFGSSGTFGGLVFIAGLVVNDVFAMHLVKYGEGRISRLVGDVFRYFYMIGFNVSFVLIFMVLLLRSAYYAQAPAGWMKVVGGFSTLVTLYYFPAYLSVGRLVMFRSYEVRGLFGAGARAFRESMRFSLSPGYFIFLVLFYGGFYVVELVSNFLPGWAGNGLIVSYLYFVYAVFPMIGEKMWKR